MNPSKVVPAAEMIVYDHNDNVPIAEVVAVAINVTAIPLSARSTTDSDAGGGSAGGGASGGGINATGGASSGGLESSCGVGGFTNVGTSVGDGGRRERRNNNNRNTNRNNSRQPRVPRGARTVLYAQPDDEVVEMV